LLPDTALGFYRVKHGKSTNSQSERGPHPIRKLPGGSTPTDTQRNPLPRDVRLHTHPHHRSLRLRWTAYSAGFILVPSQSSLWIPLSYILTAVGFCGQFVIQRLLWTLHIYILFLMFFWKDVAGKVYFHSSVFPGRKLDAKVDPGYPIGAGFDCGCVAEYGCMSFRLSALDWLYN
jgi:hypothetical protein